MKKIIIGAIKILLVLIVTGVCYHYMTLHQDDKLVGADHPKEIGESAGVAAKKIKDTAVKVKNSKKLKDLKDSFLKEYNK